MLDKVFEHGGSHPPPGSVPLIRRGYNDKMSQFGADVLAMGKELSELID